jgi:hypothetical protein
VLSHLRPPTRSPQARMAFLLIRFVPLIPYRLHHSYPSISQLSKSSKRAETVRIPYAANPGIDIRSTAYHHACQVLSKASATNGASAAPRQKKRARLESPPPQDTKVLLYSTPSRFLSKCLYCSHSSTFAAGRHIMDDAALQDKIAEAKLASQATCIKDVPSAIMQAMTSDVQSQLQSAGIQ